MAKCKYRDKLFAYTSVFAAVKLERRETVKLYESQACRSVRVVCRWCSSAGFVNFKIQNRELPYANACRGKPDKRSRVFKLSWWTKFVMLNRIELAEGQARLRQSGVNGFVKCYEIVRVRRICQGVAANQSWSKRINGRRMKT